MNTRKSRNGYGLPRTRPGLQTGEHDRTVSCQALWAAAGAQGCAIHPRNGIGVRTGGPGFIFPQVAGARSKSQVTGARSKCQMQDPDDRRASVAARLGILAIKRRKPQAGAASPREAYS